MASLCFDPDGEKRTQVEKPVPETLTAQTAEEIGFYSRTVNGRGVRVDSDPLGPLQATAGDECQKNHFLLE